eukprot:CAMPEP_0194767622 /NCGR_PEP_ID=MMETSP0323_2-20130528/36593_1 /TAXON_ID=2866 ORGANISM="Crypthecodinium cohnii, Strain Seligo" /NCGR_SAMPLE_ID=MMETSP0323_2 /ASSEMBLY_ACC=CAM_ASM_000346 /LENGTH=47 /DNA_ID= /DNA_START= /DNA_END= /DNA_ORIENTATION=
MTLSLRDSKLVGSRKPSAETRNLADNSLADTRLKTKDSVMMSKERFS